jgi:hypothetical protein
MLEGTTCQPRRFRCRAVRHRSSLNSRRTSRCHLSRERPRFHSTSRLMRFLASLYSLHPYLASLCSRPHFLSRALRHPQHLAHPRCRSRTCLPLRICKGTRRQCSPPRLPGRGRRHLLLNPVRFMLRGPQPRRPNQPHFMLRVQQRQRHPRHHRHRLPQALHTFPAISHPRRPFLRLPLRAGQARWRSEPRGWVYGC